MNEISFDFKPIRVNRKQFLKIWNEAKKHLRKCDYKITLKQLENVMPDIEILETEPTTFKGKVRLLIHEAVECEEVKRKTGKWMNPRDYYDEIMLKEKRMEIKPHVKAERIERKYAR